MVLHVGVSIKRIKELRRRIMLLLAWDACFRAAVVWFFGCSALVLLWRILQWSMPHVALICLVGLLFFCLGSIGLGLRKRPTMESIAALMDARLGGGGLIMANNENWQIPDTHALAPRWNGRTPLIYMLIAVSLLVLAVKVPLVGKNPFVELPLEIGSMIDEMEEQVGLLEEIEFIEEEQAMEWSNLIQSLEQESNGQDPAVTFEALDQLADRIQDAVAVEIDSRRMEVQKREELIAALKSALKAYDDNRDQADAAMQELSDLLQKAAQENPHLKELLESLPAFGMQQVAASCLTPEEARMLAERMSQMTKEDLERMQQLLQQGMCQSGSCQRPGGEEALKKFLAENPGCTNLMLCAGMTPSSGWGIDRGPGHAPISWLGESSEEGIDFEEQVLTAAKLDSLANSEMVGESYSAPEVNANAAVSKGGALDGTRASDSAATTHTVLPQHRETVNRFFERNEGE